jgi:O-antigen ligase
MLTRRSEGLVRLVLIVVGGLWPLVTLAGGLGFSVLLPLAALVCIRSGIANLKFRFYMVAILLALEFVAASARWSPRPINLIDINFATGSVAVRFEVLRVGLDLLWTALLLASARTLTSDDAQCVVRVISIAISIQLVIVCILTLFENQALQLFAGLMPDPGEGVQNISRNGIILSMAAPLLIVGMGRTLPFSRALLVEIVVFSLVAIVLLIRGDDSGILSIAAGLLAVGVVRVFPRYGFRILGSGIALIIMSAPIVFGQIAQNADAVAATNSAEWRLAIWRRVLEIVHSDPIFGQGLGVLRTVRDTIPDGAFKGQLLVPNHAHNMMLQLWAETGAIGATLVSLAILLAAFRMPAPRTLGVAGFLAAALAGQFTAIALVSFDLWNDWWWSCAGLLACMIVVIARAEQIEAGESRLLPSPAAD